MEWVIDLASTLFHSIGTLLLLLGLVLSLIRGFKWLSVLPIPLVFLLVLVASAMPIKGLPLLYYVRALFGNLSLLSMVYFLHLIIIYSCSAHGVQTVTGKASAPTAVQFSFGSELGLDRSVASRWILVLLGLILYVTALGFGRFDLYSMGYGHPVMWILLGVLCLLAYALGASWLCYTWLLASMLFVLDTLVAPSNFFESDNLWDYLIDPVIWFIASVKLTREALVKHD